MELAQIAQIGTDVRVDGTHLKQVLESAQPLLKMMDVTGKKVNATTGDVICIKNPDGSFCPIGIFTGAFSTGREIGKNRGNIIVAGESAKRKGIPVLLASQNPEKCYVLPEHLIELYTEMKTSA
jgi:hypothetical protein